MATLLATGSVEVARAKLGRIDLFEARRGQLLGIVAALIDADPDEGISTDELMGVSGLTSESVRFEEAPALERAPIEQLQEHAPDLERGQTSSLQLRFGTGIELLDGRGRVVGRLAKRNAVPNGMTVVCATVAGILRRDRATVEPEYQRSVKCEVWEVVVPEFICAWADSAGVSATA